MTLSSHDLADQFDVETLAPFGAIVRSRTPDEDITRLPVPAARELVRKHRVLVMRGFRSPSDCGGLARYAESWGPLMTWPFGTVLDLVEHEQPVDSVFDNGGVSYHWDGMFVEQIPEFQVFQCVQVPAEDHGGRTVFCDTTLVLASASPAARELWEALALTYGITKKSHYGGAVASPLVVEHPDRGYPTMRYLEPVPGDVHYVNRPTVRFPDDLGDRAADVQRSLRDALYDPRHQYAHQWQAGDVVIADNYTLLHGREPYTSRCGRHLRRVHVLGDPPFTNPALLEG
jgi:alpha-ketoglutarate-dependent taurine dioxygenase